MALLEAPEDEIERAKRVVIKLTTYLSAEGVTNGEMSIIFGVLVGAWSKELSRISAPYIRLVLTKALEDNGLGLVVQPSNDTPAC
jgi:hypothetical protein